MTPFPSSPPQKCALAPGFRGVPEEVWNFHIGGYQVCEKWLKDRQAKGGKNPRPGRVLTDEDIDHYQKIVVALSETIRIMAEIDEVIEAHGGWPGAFQTNDETAEKADSKTWQMTRGQFHEFRVSLNRFTNSIGLDEQTAVVLNTHFVFGDLLLGGIQPEHYRFPAFANLIGGL